MVLSPGWGIDSQIIGAPPRGPMHAFDVAPITPSIYEDPCQSSCSCSRPKPARPPRHSAPPRYAPSHRSSRRAVEGPAAAPASGVRASARRVSIPGAEERHLSQSPTAAMATPSPPVGGLCSSRSPAPPSPTPQPGLARLFRARTLQDDGRSSPGRARPTGMIGTSTRVPCPWPATPAAPTRGTPHHGAGRAARRRRPPRRQGGRRRAAPGWQARRDRGGAGCRHGRGVIALRPIGATTSSRVMPKSLSTMTSGAEAPAGTHRQAGGPFRHQWSSPESRMVTFGPIGSDRTGNACPMERAIEPATGASRSAQGFVTANDAFQQWVVPEIEVICAWRTH